MTRKIIALGIAVVALLHLAFLPASHRFTSSETIDSFESNEKLTFSRLQTALTQIELPEEEHNTQKYVNWYFSKKKRDAEIILGKSPMYLPLIESYINEMGLPEELKYLPIVESALNPKAISSRGAVGLWQLMPRIARIYGLTIDANVDERRDPHKSTKAALQFLSDLYDEYGDWTLAMAAYNCGAPRMNKAIRFADSKNFWDVMPYLPKETQRYVPKILAAAYLVNYYPYHNIEPDYLDFELLYTEGHTVNQKINLRELAEAVDVPLKTIVKLNPSYRRTFIPANEKGNVLTLPKNTWETAFAFLDGENEVVE